MDQKLNLNLDRRDFFKATGAGLGAAGLAVVAEQQAAASPLSEKEKLARIASNTWPLRYIFKSRMGFGTNPRTAEMKKKYGEITMLDFPQFTKDTFPGVTHMDLFSGLFGDVADDSMYVEVPLLVGKYDKVIPIKNMEGLLQRLHQKQIEVLDAGHNDLINASVEFLR